MLWDLAEGKRLYSLDAGDIIHSLVFSPNRYWLCAATQTSIKVRGRRAPALVGSAACCCCRCYWPSFPLSLSVPLRKPTTHTHHPPPTTPTPHHTTQIWDLESKSVVDDLRPEFSKTFGKKATIPYCVSLAWSADGSTLYAGYTDGDIRVFVVSHGM